MQISINFLQLPLKLLPRHERAPPLTSGASCLAARITTLPTAGNDELLPLVVYYDATVIEVKLIKHS